MSVEAGRTRSVNDGDVFLVSSGLEGSAPGVPFCFAAATRLEDLCVFGATLTSVSVERRTALLLPSGENDTEEY